MEILTKLKRQPVLKFNVKLCAFPVVTVYIHRVSEKNLCKIVYVKTSSNFHQFIYFLVGR